MRTFFSRRPRLAGLLSCLALAHSAVFSLMAQTEKSNADRWLDALPPVPEFSAPATRGAWEKQRGEIRAKLAQSLGKIPARPVTAAVKTLSREDRVIAIDANPDRGTLAERISK